MVDVTRTFQVPHPQWAVREYLQDFGRAEQWDPGTVRCRRADDGPVRVGARWDNVSEFLGNTTELTYELVTLDDDRLVFRGQNTSATATDDIGLAAGPEPDTTTITYIASIEFHGVAKLTAPVAKVAFERVGDQTVTSMTDALAQHARA